ncbi:hypothetical protein LIER_25140 [Lithospermum erythrorhizon]|uniref:Retrotransposon Copia-like N-terminal domain-containing protein n=1 Tax=Lithospermum erythrorhizon TaxID=34254 RepID=A0AAV3R3N2_LITER
MVSKLGDDDSGHHNDEFHTNHEEIHDHQNENLFASVLNRQNSTNFDPIFANLTANFANPTVNFINSTSHFPNQNVNFSNSRVNISQSNLFPNIDPLQLHHSDHQNYVLSTFLLNQNNFHHWKRFVEISLMAKNKIGFINGECT